MPLSDQRRRCISLDAVHDIFPAVAEQQLSCQFCNVHAGTHIDIQTRHDQQRARETSEHDISQRIACYREKGHATFCSITLLLVYRNNVDIFPLLRETLSAPAVKLCCLLCKSHHPYLMTSAGMLSGPAVFLSLRMRMALAASSKDGVSSSFEMISSIGRSSRRPGSVVWTLFSWFCRY